MTIRKQPVWLWISVIIAATFGTVTIKSDGGVLCNTQAGLICQF